jgi:hypothetical protein
MGVWHFPHAPDHDVPEVERAVNDFAVAAQGFGYARVLAELSGNPSRADLGAIESLRCSRANQSSADVLILYLSSHGAEENGRHYILLSDYGRGPRSQTCVETSDLAYWLASAGFQAVLLIIDACFAGSATTSVVREVARVVERAGSQMAVITTASSISDSQAGAFVDALKTSFALAETSYKCGGPGAEYLSLEGLVSLTNQHLSKCHAPQTVRLLTLSESVLPFFPYSSSSGSAAAASSDVGTQPAPTSDIPSFETWLRRQGDRERTIRDVLTAVSLGEGDGFPFDDIMPAVTSAISGHLYTDQDIDAALKLAIRYLQVNHSHGRATYQLAYPIHVAYLQSNIDVRLAQQAITEELGRLSPDLKWAHPYTRKHIHDHAAKAAQSALQVARAAERRSNTNEHPASRGRFRVAANGLSAAALMVVTGIGIHAWDRQQAAGILSGTQAALEECRASIETSRTETAANSATEEADQASSANERQGLCERQLNAAQSSLASCEAQLRPLQNGKHSPTGLTPRATKPALTNQGSETLKHANDYHAVAIAGEAELIGRTSVRQLYDPKTMLRLRYTLASDEDDTTAFEWVVMTQRAKPINHVDLTPAISRKVIGKTQALDWTIEKNDPDILQHIRCDQGAQAFTIWMESTTRQHVRASIPISIRVCQQS